MPEVYRVGTLLGAETGSVVWKACLWYFMGASYETPGPRTLDNNPIEAHDERWTRKGVS
jgi:hypothetical protein